MKPITFEEANRGLLAPEGEEDKIDTLPAWTNGKECVSLWRPSWRERLSFLLFGRVWLRVLSGHTQPPVSIEARRTLFEKGE